MRKLVLFSSFVVSFTTFAQTDSRTQVKSELIQWDAVRGQWLAESFEAMANNQPIPDRTFPEDLTPDEMYRLVPQELQTRIQSIVNQEANKEDRVPNQTPSDPNRRPVGATPNAGRNPQPDRYPDYFRNPNCNLVTGRTYGDPHIRTFDGKTYSFQTVGEYVLSSSPDRMFEVQARQKPETNSVSLNTAVAMNVYGDRVGIYASDAPDPHAGTPIRVNGRSVYLNNETFYLPHGGTIENNGREYIVTWPTGEKVQAKLSTSSGMKFMNISVFVKECRGDYRGLLGNANGRSEDDFSAGNNRVNLASSRIFDPFDTRDFGRASTAMEREHLAFLARDFGNQFLVNDQTSLFEYGFGQSSWSFYDPSFPRTHLTLADISQADRERARRECMQQGILAEDMNGCVMDLAHANIPPTPRPSVPNRVGGDRAVTPVTDRRPNVNRPDVFERVPASTDRVPNSGDRGNRIPTSGSERMNGTVQADDKGTLERTPANPTTKKPVEQTGGNPATIENTRTYEKPAVVRKPVTSTAPATRNPEPNGGADRKPAERTINPSGRETPNMNGNKPVSGQPTRESASPTRQPTTTTSTPMERRPGQSSTPVNVSAPKAPSSSPARSTGSTTNTRSGR